MSIIQSNKIDSLTIEKNKCILGISDHLIWDEQHILFLQEKINNYLHYILEGQIKDDVAELNNYNIIIQLVYKHKPNEDYMKYLVDLKEKIEKYNVYFEYGGIEII